MCKSTHCVLNYTLCVRLYIVCEITVRSPFRLNCGKKIPLSQFFYTSAAIDASDKYQVCAPPPTVKTGKTLMIWRYEASKSDPRSTLSLAEDCLRPN